MSLIRNFFRWLAKKREPKYEANENAWAFGLQKSPEDERDKLYEVTIPTGASMPTSIDLSEYLLPIKNQGWIGSCASHAICSSMELWVTMTKGANQAVPLSELYHYYVVRQKEYGNTFPKDSGQYVRDGMKAAKAGISPEMLWPYSEYKYNIKPDLFASSFARWFTLKAYHRCWSDSSIKYSLSQKQPVVVGVDWFFDDTLYGKGGRTGEIIATGTRVGGHAIAFVGYDDAHKNPDGSVGAFKFANSWGTGWGQKGFGWMSYSKLRANLIEAWAVEVA